MAAGNDDQLARILALTRAYRGESQTPSSPVLIEHDNQRHNPGAPDDVYSFDAATQGAGSMTQDDIDSISQDVDDLEEDDLGVIMLDTGNSVQEARNARPVKRPRRRTEPNLPRTIDMGIFPPSGYVRDSTLVSWMAALPVSPVPKSYSWSNEATTAFILALCEARRAGLITPTRLEASNKQGRVRIWEYIRQRFCESGLYIMVPGLTDVVLENKYKAEMDVTFKPYKKLVSAQYSGTGFEMDANGQFTASDTLWERHLAIKGNGKDGWLRFRGMPLWAQYEEAFGEDVATGEAAQQGKKRQRAAFAKYVRNINDINHDVGPRHNVVQRREQSVTAGPSTPEPSRSLEGAHSLKRRRETISKTIPGVNQMAETLEEVSKLTATLYKHEDRQLKAYMAVQELRLGKAVEKAAKQALTINLNVADVLRLSK